MVFDRAAWRCGHSRGRRPSQQAVDAGDDRQRADEERGRIRRCSVSESSWQASTWSRSAPASRDQGRVQGTPPARAMRRWSFGIAFGTRRPLQRASIRWSFRSSSSQVSRSRRRAPGRGFEDAFGQPFLFLGLSGRLRERSASSSISPERCSYCAWACVRLSARCSIIFIASAWR